MVFQVQLHSEKNRSLRLGAFLSEAALEKPKTLERLNELFQVWLSECYQNKPHSALENKPSPETVYSSDKKALRLVDPDELTNAFLHCETRKVDKSGCISFLDRKYEVGLPFIGCTVDVVFDPADTRSYPSSTKGIRLGVSENSSLANVHASDHRCLSI